MEKKNQKLTIIVGCLLLVISVSLAYFVGSILINGIGSKGSVTTANINGATLAVEGLLEFNDLDILPGHKTVSSIKLTATGEPVLIPYNLIWKGTSGISQLNYTVYKTTSEVSVSTSCEKKTSTLNGSQILSEECSISNLNSLGSVIASGSINKSASETKVTLVPDEFITSSKAGEVVYYYVVLEYPNLDEDQSSDMGATFTGEVTVEESNATADINILGIYLEQSDGTYRQVDNVPNKETNYTLNENESTCTNNAKPSWNVEDWSLEVSSLSQSGTDCNLYFYEKELTASETILSTLAVKTGAPDFSQTATTDEGVYAVEDGMYGGTSYYWRGAATTNYVQFAGYCWRIIRINGDGTMRLIYDGATCHANGTSTSDSMAVASTAYNAQSHLSEYVGWTYTEGLQRPTDNKQGTNSDAKTVLESWYTTNLVNNESKIAVGKFCNDRNVANGSTWASTGSSFNYAGHERLYVNYSPTLSCDTLDTYLLKVGLITADEIAFAGGLINNKNTSYYLYNGKNYWTMTPQSWFSAGLLAYANTFYIDGDGNLTNLWVYGTPSIRPVINLSSDITISSGNGTLDNPYVVL